MVVLRAELYKVQKVQKKFNWTDFQLKFKVPFFPLVHEGEGGELWTWVESQFIWTSSELFELDTALKKEYSCLLKSYSRENVLKSPINTT